MKEQEFAELGRQKDIVCPINRRVLRGAFLTLWADRPADAADCKPQPLAHITSHLRIDFLLVHNHICNNKISNTKTPISDQPEAPKNLGAEVHITNLLQFEPHQVTIKAGQAVLWTNTSFDMHTVTADASIAADVSHVLLPDGAEPFNSGLIAPEKTFTKTFAIPGRYRYFCIPHEATGMVGEVVVTDE